MEKRSKAGNRILKIAITGPESTGKSELTEQLAKHYNTVWVPEYAREYLDKLQRKYEQRDILTIAEGQLYTEEKAFDTARQFLFCDTEFLVLKIWSENAFGKCDVWIQEKFTTHLYDLYLLMNTDIPWEYDPQREHPHLREHFFNLYKNELEASNLPYFVISGTGEERLKNAIRKIQSYFKI